MIEPTFERIRGYSLPCSPVVTISNILQQCTFKQLRQIHAFILATSLIRQSQIALKFLRRSTEFGTMGYASLVFCQMGGVFCTDITLWNAMIRGYAYNGPTQECISLYDEMRQRGLKPNNFTYPYVLNSCSEMGCLRLGLKVQSQILKSGFESGIEVATALFRMYVKMIGSSELAVTKRESLVETRNLFDSLCVKPVELWNQMITQYGIDGDLGSARWLFDEMPVKDVVSWNSMISIYAKAGEVTIARHLFEQMPDKNVVSWTSIVKAYASAGDLVTARKLFEEMPYRNTVSWNCMISSYSQHGQFKEALHLFARMQSEGLNADAYTFVSLLSACSHLHDLQFGKWIHYLIEDWFTLGVIVGTSLVEMYANCGDVDRAFTIFIKTDKKDVFCWNVMIKSLAINGRTEDALKIFFSMQESGFDPNEFTFSAALFACSHGAMIEDGTRIFHSMERDYGISPTLEHYGCFVDLLSRNGHLEEALLVVKAMPLEPDIAIWGALLGGCKGDPDLAHRVIDAADQLNVKEPGVHVLLWDIHALAGQWQEASSTRQMMEQKQIWKKAGWSSLLVQDS